MYDWQRVVECFFAVKKCEFYLLGNEYTLYTDHEPLIHLQTFRNLVKNRFRWIEYLESMNVKIFKSSHQRCFVKKCVLRNFAKFKGKQLCQRLFSNKLAGLRPDEHLFNLTPPDDCFWILYFPGKKNFISRNISEGKAWNATDIRIVNLELTNYNKGELLEE